MCGESEFDIYKIPQIQEKLYINTKIIYFDLKATLFLSPHIFTPKGVVFRQKSHFCDFSFQYTIHLPWIREAFFRFENVKFGFLPKSIKLNWFQSHKGDPCVKVPSRNWKFFHIRVPHSQKPPDDTRLQFFFLKPRLWNTYAGTKKRKPVPGTLGTGASIKLETTAPNILLQNDDWI